MINRKAFYDIFFYNRENAPAELHEMAEKVWRAYMEKYGLGLDAGASGEPTYEEVREITYMANYAAEMVAAKLAAEEAEAAAKKAAAKAAEEAEIEAAQMRLEAMVGGMMAEPAEEPEEEAEEMPEEAPAEEILEEAAEESEEAPAEDTADEIAEETAEEAETEAAQAPSAEVSEAPVEEIGEEIAEAAEEATEEAVREEPVQVLPKPKQAVEAVKIPVQPVVKSGAKADLDAWVGETVRWCQSKGLLCIQTADGGDVYLHVYLPHKKEVHHVGKWCFNEVAEAAELEKEAAKLYAYCTGYADCFGQFMK